MREIFRYIYKNLLPGRIRQSIDIFNYLRMPIVSGLNEKRVLVLSPHPDDDIIGCGGTIYKYKLNGVRFTSVYMTDGRKGNPKYDEKEMVEIRKEEAKRSAAILGIERLIFLDNKDNELSPTTKTLGELSAILNDLKPEAVFLPFLLDNHPDHMATNQVLLGVMKSSFNFMCYAYGIWTPLPAFNLTIDITPYVDIKRKAIEEHRSQTELRDFTGASLGLSKYYSVISDSKGWVEPFIVCPSYEYRRLAETIGW